MPQEFSNDVIVPVYNSAQKVLGTLNRLLKLRESIQNSIKIVIINDGSTDDTAAALDSLSHPDLKIFHSTNNEGRASARNLGAEAAEGDFIVFLDADCRPLNAEYLNTLRDIIARGADVVYGPVVGGGADFWLRYAGIVEKRRNRFANAGNTVRGYHSKMRETARYSPSFYVKDHPGAHGKMSYGRLESGF